MIQPIKPDPPHDLEASGRELWDSLTCDYSVVGLEHPLAECCRLQDRLQTIRARMASANPADFGRLVNAETKVIAAQARYWRILGLDKAPTPKRRPHAKADRA